VVGADAFAAVAGADLVFALRGVFGRLLVLLALEQAGAEHGHGAGLVFDLRTTVGAEDHQSGGLVDDAHGGVGGVDGLASGAAGALHRDVEVLRIDVDVHLLGFGQNGDRHRRGVDAAVGLGAGNALHAVHAALELELFVNILSADQKTDFAEAAFFRRRT